MGFAIILICMVFGWSGGSSLVRSSYADAKVKASDMKEERKESLRRRRHGGPGDDADLDPDAA